MMWKSRTSRIGPSRRTLTVERLEDRTLLNGVVRAILDPSTELLQLTGDSGNNQFTIAPSPVAGNIRVAGNRGTFTSINGVAFVDFPVGGITDISMTLLNGKDNVTLRDFSISGNLNINFANADDVFAMPNFTAANIIFNGSLPNPGGGGGGGGGGGSSGGGGGIGSGNNNGLLPPLG